MLLSDLRGLPDFRTNFPIFAIDSEKLPIAINGYISSSTII